MCWLAPYFKLPKAKACARCTLMIKSLFKGKSLTRYAEDFTLGIANFGLSLDDNF